MRDLSPDSKVGIDPMRNVDPMITGAGPRMSVGAAQGAEYGITAQDLLRVVQRRYWIVALATILLTGLAVGYSFNQTPVYEASIKIIVGQKNESVALGSDISGLERLTLTMAQAVDTRPVAQAVIHELDLRESPEGLVANLTAEQIGDTQFIEVRYRHTSPEQAQRTVSAVGDVFSEQVSDVSPTTNAITARVWEPAVTPYAPVSPNPLRNGLLAFMIGGVLGLGLAFLREHLDNSWRSLEEVEQITGIPVLGVIPRVEKSEVIPRVEKSKVKKGAS